MSFQPVRVWWMLLDGEQRTEAVELARQGERLALAFGARPFLHSADAIPGESSVWDAPMGPRADAAVAWADEYSGQVPDGSSGRGMPLDVLWAGITEWDSGRDGVDSRRLAATTPAAWPVILERLRSAPAVVRGLADWWASRARGLASSGNELEVMQERLQRAWWAEYAATLPAPPPVGTTTGGVASNVNATPIASSATPWREILVAAAVYGLLRMIGR